ncbi:MULTISPECIES: YtxH domain-containing protein [Rufibacter]|uniref:Gas vesicle protein n=1 Tax=Rufibacter quisquiliarum TaxID=1549639 RepID=A0A839G868_9BACT|nr:MULTISPECIES: YtxH domain-containing protein [Rufibacter]MBA9075634.1 gas vesicle protein [Rufibacter quisquiliarum]
MKDNGKIILALLAGASAGVVAGILMAPEAGESTRGNLKKSASKLSQGLNEKLQGSMDQLQALTASAGALVGRKGGSKGAAADVVNTGSNTTATSHLDNNPTGGNVDAAGATSSSLGNTGGTNDAPASSGKKSKGGTGASGKKATDTTTTKAKSSASSGQGSSKGSGGGSNASA